MRIWQPLFWLIVAMAAAGALVLEWRQPPRLPALSIVNPPDAVTVPPLQPFEPLPLLRYAEIVERPIFIEARRPEEDEPAAPPAPPPELDRPLNLIGVVVISNTATALLRPEEPNPKVLRIPQGGNVDGWMVESVQAGKVVLRKGHQVRELALIRLPSPPRPSPPAKAVPRRPPPAPPSATPAPVPGP